MPSTASFRAYTIMPGDLISRDEDGTNPRVVARKTYHEQDGHGIVKLHFDNGDWWSYERLATVHVVNTYQRDPFRKGARLDKPDKH